MLNIEDPINFIIDKRIDNYQIKYVNLREVSQGGPEIGHLMINEVKFSSFLFGGPFFYEKNKIYLPLYINNFFSSGFKLAVIDLITQKVNVLSNLKNLIFLDKIENSKIYFYEDMKREKYSTLLLV